MTALPVLWIQFVAGLYIVQPGDAVPGVLVRLAVRLQTGCLLHRFDGLDSIFVIVAVYLHRRDIGITDGSMMCCGLGKGRTPSAGASSSIIRIYSA